MRLCFAFLLILVACGGASKKGSNGAAGGPDAAAVDDDVKVLQLKKDLPKCQKDLRGALRYIAEEQKFYKCSDSDEWAEIDLRGPAGAAAKPCGVSSTGLIACADGSTFQIPQAKDGIDGRSCTVSNSGLVTCGNATYQIPTPSSGVDGASCSVSNSGLVTCGSSTYQIPLPTNGADGASCSVNGSGLITCGSTTYQVPTPTNGSNGNDGQSIGIRILSISQGATCAAGGYSLQSFVDADKDGAYDTGETLLGSASNLCRGENGSAGSPGFSSLVATSAEGAGANCANGGTKIQTGLDNGDGGGTASNGTLEAGEVDSTGYACNALSQLLKVYSSTGTALFHYVGQFNFDWDVRSEVYMLVKALTANTYTAYQIGYAAGGSVNVNETPSQIGFYVAPHYVNTDCSGSGYLPAKMDETGTHKNDFQRVLFARAFSDFRFYGGPSNEATIGGSYQSAGGSFTRRQDFGGSCSSSSVLNAGGGFLIAVRSAIFPYTLNSGWYVAP